MTKRRQVLVAMAALAAGVATAGVGVGTAVQGQAITISGNPDVVESAGGTTLTISGLAFSPVTVDAGPGSAQRGADFDFQRQVITLAADDAGRGVATVDVDVVDDETDEPAEGFSITACAAEATGASCEKAATPGHQARHEMTIQDDDGALDAAVCSGQLRPVGLLLDRLQVAGLFEGCS